MSKSNFGSSPAIFLEVDYPTFAISQGDSHSHAHWPISYAGLTVIFLSCTLQQMAHALQQAALNLSETGITMSSFQIPKRSISVKSHSHIAKSPQQSLASSKRQDPHVINCQINLVHAIIIYLYLNIIFVIILLRSIYIYMCKWLWNRILLFPCNLETLWSRPPCNSPRHIKPWVGH